MSPDPRRSPPAPVFTMVPQQQQTQAFDLSTIRSDPELLRQLEWERPRLTSPEAIVENLRATVGILISLLDKWVIDDADFERLDAEAQVNKIKESRMQEWMETLTDSYVGCISIVVEDGLGDVVEACATICSKEDADRPEVRLPNVPGIQEAAAAAYSTQQKNLNELRKKRLGELHNQLRRRARRLGSITDEFGHESASSKRARDRMGKR